MDRYVRENWLALQVFYDRGHDEFHGVDGRTLHALARRGLVWFEHDRTGGLTQKGRQVLADIQKEKED